MENIRNNNLNIMHTTRTSIIEVGDKGNADASTHVNCLI